MPSLAPRNDVLRIPTARVFQPLLPSHRYKGARGGRGGAKSNFYADNIIDLSICNPGMRTVCIREVQKSLRRSSKLLLEDKIAYWKLENVFESKREEIIGPGGGFMIFQGMQDHTADSIKSLEGFDIFFTEEASSLSNRSFGLLRPTARPTIRTVLEQPELWFGWNPQDPKDPVDEFFRSNPPDSVLVNCNWRDNPWFPEVLRTEMEWDKRRDFDKYRHVWEGEYQTRSEARVFKNWRVEEFETSSLASFMFGADWGFSQDPTVLVRCYLVPNKNNPKARGTIYVDYEAWKIGCSIDSVPALFDALVEDAPQMARNWVVVADSARPETIDFMKRHGYPKMQASHKGANSVNEGVEFLKSYDIVVHPRCTHVIDELTHYKYKMDPHTELVTPVLEDKKNHTIDSLRYAVEHMRRRRTAGAW
jgi:phage terminase large subunit